MRKSILLLTFSLLLAACSQNTPVETIVISSDNLKCDDTCLVFTPNTKGQFEKTPTLFLLHGWSGCYKNWSDKYDLQEISNRTGFRIICPDGFYNSWYVNSSDPEGMQYRTFWDEDLWPLMKGKYGLDPEYTFITGLSMGGHGAINLYLDHPENFRSAGSMSGVLNINHTNLIDKWVSKMLGEYTKENTRYNEESAVYRLQEYVNTYPMALEKVLIVSCGYEDFYAVCTKEFADKCEELKIPHVEHLSKATHSWKYWGYALEEHIAHFTKILKGENLGF